MGLPCSRKSRGVTKAGRSCCCWSPSWGSAWGFGGAGGAESAVSAPDMVNPELLWTEPHGGDVGHAWKSCEELRELGSGSVSRASLRGGLTTLAHQTSWPLTAGLVIA